MSCRKNKDKRALVYLADYTKQPIKGIVFKENDTVFHLQERKIGPTLCEITLYREKDSEIKKVGVFPKRNSVLSEDNKDNSWLSKLDSELKIANLIDRLEPYYHSSKLDTEQKHLQNIERKKREAIAKK